MDLDLKPFFDLMTRFPAPAATMERFVALFGRDFPGAARPDHVQAWQPGYCFMNSHRLMRMRHDLRYVEGFALRLDSIPVHHAWCIDREDRVIDNTWDPPENCAYHGVVMEKDFVIAQVLTFGQYSLLDSGTGPNVELMSRWCAANNREPPDWLEELRMRMPPKKRRRTQ